MPLTTTDRSLVAFPDGAIVKININNENNIAPSFSIYPFRPSLILSSR